MLTVRAENEDGDCVVYVDGPGEISDTFNPSFDAPVFLAFSDGTVLRLEFQDGIRLDECGWRITIERGGTANWEVEPGTPGSGDVAHTKDKIFWCVAGDIMICED